MRRLFSVMRVVGILSLMFVVGKDTHSQRLSDYALNQIIIKLQAGIPSSEKSLVLSDLGATVIRQFSLIDAELWEISGITVEQAILRFGDDPRVEYVEPNYIVRATQVFPNDPDFDKLWGLHNTGQTGGTPDADVDGPEAWQVGTGDTVVVGVIDTGVDWTHEDLAANIWTNPGEVPGNGIDDDGNGFVDDVRGWDFANNDNNPMDDNRHGTHVAGTIAAVGNNGVGVVGVSWSARIMPLKFLHANGSGFSGDAIAALEYATLMGAHLTNNSWGGGGFSTALRDAIDASGQVRMLFIAAAGNKGQDADLSPHYPAAYDLDNIISVAWTNHNDNLATNSNFGAVSVDLGAPGNGIYSTMPGNTYGHLSGTSMAAPHVSGTASLFWSKHPEFTALQVKTQILRSVDPVPALAGKTVTGGRLNTFTTMLEPETIPPAAVTDLATAGPTSNSITLTWTATGNDSLTGIAAGYDIRYSLSPIDATNFDSATEVAGEPLPQPSGTPESFTVDGLDFSTTYHFAMKVLDFWANTSSVSNSPSGTTLGPPDISVSPASLTASLLTGEIATQELTVRNVGEGTLDFSLSGPPWLSTDPASGRVWTGDSATVDVTFDATGLAGGDYNAGLVVASNDPDEPVVAVPVHLHVTEAPTIAISESVLDFGLVPIGLTAGNTLVISNIGTALLAVSEVTLDDPTFGVDTAGFILAPGASRELPVTFAPAASGVFVGTLTIVSNDPFVPALAVTLQGKGVTPPTIAVSPESLSETLTSGSTSTLTLDVSNINSLGLDLVFNIVEGTAGVSISEVSQAPSRAHAKHRTRPANPIRPSQGHSRPRADSDPWTAVGRSAPGPDVRSLASSVSDANVPARERADAGSTARTRGDTHIFRAEGTANGPGLRILLLHSGADVTMIQDSLLAYPDVSAVDAFDGVSVTPVLDDLLPFHAVVVVVNVPFDEPVVIGDLLADYVDAGGGVILSEGSFLVGLGIDFAVHGRFETGGYTPFEIGSSFSGSARLGTFDGQHSIMNCATDARTSIITHTQLISGAIRVASWQNGQPFIATKGSKVVGFNAFLESKDEGLTHWAEDIPLILHNAVLWTTGVEGSCWASACPTTGIVPADSTMFVTVTFAADAQCVTGGDHFDTLLVVSNDPFTPEVRVPIHLNVIPIPDIAVSDGILDFRSVVIGFSGRDTLVVSNEGTEVLVVNEVTLDNPVFDADTTGFVLGPGEHRNLAVTFSPSNAVVSTGIMTILSNDPDEPEVIVLLQGEGLLPPDISVFPLELNVSLFTDETSAFTVTIENHGEGDLLFNVFEGAEVLAVTTAPTVSTRGSRASGAGQGAARARPSKEPPSDAGGDIRRLADLVKAGEASSTPQAVPAYRFDTGILATATTGEQRRILILHSASRPSLIQSLLLAFPDVSTVDVYNGRFIPPTAESLLQYHCVIAMNDVPFDDPVAIGDVLADYVDFGGGVILTIGTFFTVFGVDYAIHGRFMDEGYSPFEIGSWFPGIGRLGSFDASHPIMRDVTEAYTSLVTETHTTPGASLLASFTNLQRFIATKGVDVVAVNGYLESPAGGFAFWGGDFPEILHNAALWTSGERLCWVSPDPVYDRVPPDSTTYVTIEFNADLACAGAGDFRDTLVVRSNDPDEPVIPIPVHLIVTPRRTIPLSADWNLVSWSLDSEPDSTTSLLSGVMSDLTVALGFDGGGLTFSPSIPPQFNTLNTMDHLHGYWLKMTQAQTLHILGDPVSPQTPIPLATGWNLVSYLPDVPDSTAHALGGVLASTVVVLGFDGAGLMFDPAIPPEFNTLQVMEPGRGYWIKTTGPVTLVYPETSVHPAGSAAAAQTVAGGASVVTPTTEWIGIWGSGVKMDGVPLAAGTMVRAVDRDNVVCGEFTVKSEGKIGLMAVYKDDPGTPTDEGVGAGEQIALYVGDVKISSGITWTGMGDVIDISDVVTAIDIDLPTLPTQYALLQNYPNPFNPTTNIRYELPQRSAVRLVIYNVKGQVVRELVNESQPAGRYVARWDGRNASGYAVSSGVYFYKIKAGTFVTTKKMVFLK
ncbi:MAG: S8 family serine peptidase [Candidatus Krumholzibacteria bacterium]